MTSLSDGALLALLERHAPLVSVALAPTLQAFCAPDELPLWLALEDACGHRLEAPFFAVPWPGAQAVARGLVDGVIDVAGRAVLEVGCGSGLASVAAALHGARAVTATDVDTFALQVTRLLARVHGISVTTAPLDLLDDVAVARALDAHDPGDVVIVADVVYNRDLGAALGRLLAGCRARGLDVVVADSGRPFFEPTGLVAVAVYDVPVPIAVEGRGTRQVTTWRWR